MLNLILAIIVSFIFSPDLVQDEYEFTFRIQVAASSKPLSKSSKLYKDLPEIEGVKFEDGYIRYFYGKYETFYSAKNDLGIVKEKGYKDAYIICIHKGKRLTVDEAIDMIYSD